MRKFSSIALIAALTLVFSSGVFAAEYGSSTRGEDMKSNPAMETSGTATSMLQTNRLNIILGKDVKNMQNENLGKIVDVVFDRNTDKIAYAILESGGILGMGEKLHAIPFKALKSSTSGDYLVLNIDKEKLKNAPTFEKKKWPDFADRRWSTDVYRYYGVQPYWEER
ncbi:MAG: PRC-barrel domain-containing protein [Thermodesulfovibrionales bacterium]